MSTAPPSAATLESPEIRHAGADLLSLALLDARNHTLRLLDAFGEALTHAPDEAGVRDWLPPPLWLAGHVGWFQERWIARNPSRHAGAGGEGSALRLASIDPGADAWWDPTQHTMADRWSLPLPGPDAVKAYLMATLDTTTALLDKAPAGDDALHVYRLALRHEDQAGEILVRAAQALGTAVPLAATPRAAPRDPLTLPATRWTLGLPPRPGFVADLDAGEQGVAVPECEIDAQPVSWAQFNEFVDDGGYDRAGLWDPAGWDWLQRAGLTEGRRAPRHVTQIGSAGGAVLQTRFGRPVRLAPAQPVQHATWWEADAWCRWAGRRLPTEVEWEMAATVAAHRGFRWGEVWEWTAGSLRAGPGYRPSPGQDDLTALFGKARVLRGASFATRPRLRHPRHRGWALPGDDTHFVGFRSCAV